MTVLLSLVWGLIKPYALWIAAAAGGLLALWGKGKFDQARGRAQEHNEAAEKLAQAQDKVRRKYQEIDAETAKRKGGKRETIQDSVDRFNSAP